MFCKNCGSEIDPGAAICVKCGYEKGTGQNYCQNCGQPIDPNAAFCTKCGYEIKKSYDPATQKSKLAAGLFGIFLGGLGVHNFYLGYTGKAIAQIILSFCFGIGAIWGFIEGIMIFTGSINKDANGVPLKKDV
jgi:TM2 domain-containing membrane protein YozV